MQRFATALLLIFFLQPAAIWAQQPMFERLSYPVQSNGYSMKFPFAGGLNAPQFSEADLNHDHIQDLVVFDRSGNRLETFINKGIAGEVSYEFAPGYACYFPEMIDYALMRDFDKDGAADIFTAASAPGKQEIQVYKGYYDGDVLKFQPYKFKYPGCSNCEADYIWYPDEFNPGTWQNLPINKGDLPAFDDINGDGDIDILTFEASAGGHIWLLENQSVEMGLPLSDMRFRLANQCWGGVYESGQVACICDLAPTPDCCAPCVVGAPEDRNQHPGSTVMTFDQEGDGDKEAVLGDVSFSCLNYLENGGNKNKAWINVQQDNFPDYDIPLDLYVYPSSFYLDVDNDGKKDMLAAPNHPNVGEDRKNVWFYKNTASSGHHFELQTRDLFTHDMIDLGTMARPAFADVNGDGLLDMVAGNYGYYTPGVSINSRLFLYLNVGTPFEPAFKLEDSDWLGLSEFSNSDYDFAPAFGDIDSDGALDLLVGGDIGGFYCYRNHAGPDEPMNLQRDQDVMWVSMDVGGSVSTPFLYDLDRDGLLDIIAGERTGFINYFRNIGTATTPRFPESPTYGKIGQVDTRSLVDAAGYAAPTIITTNDGPVLITGTQGGHMEAYFVGENYQDTYVATDMKFGNIDAGARSHPAFADLNTDGVLEMAVGNYDGGIAIYKTQLVDCSTSVKSPGVIADDLHISPNPSSQWVKLQWSNRNGRWSAFNTLGQFIAEGSFDNGLTFLDVRSWPAGVYMIAAQSGSLHQTTRLVVSSNRE